MRGLKTIVFMVLLGYVVVAAIPRNHVACRDLVNQMLDSIKHIKTQRCDVKVLEHIEGRMMYAESHIKINTSPKKIYYKSVLKGNEALWVQGENKGNAIVHSNSFPLMNLELDPYGSIMRKDNHHTIFDLGFHYIGSIVSTTVLRHPKDFDKHFTCAGSITWNQRDCYQLIINFPEYKYVEHVAVKGETAYGLSLKYGTSEYKIRYKNDLSSYYGPIKEGKKIVIPIPYANKVVIYIDKKLFLPINVKVYDEDGLFEAYEFTNIKINQPFATDEFSVGYKGYNFKN